MSRAPRPHGTRPSPCPASSSASHRRGAIAGGDEDLEAVLAGVAGARDRAADAGDLAVREPVVLDRAEIDAGQRLEDLPRLRPLHGDQRVAIARVDDRRVADLLTRSAIQA